MALYKSYYYYYIIIIIIKSTFRNRVRLTACVLEKCITWRVEVIALSRTRSGLGVRVSASSQNIYHLVGRLGSGIGVPLFKFSLRVYVTSGEIYH